MLDQLGTRAKQAVDMATTAGADGVWATASKGRSVEFSYRDGKLEKVQENTSRSISLEIYAEGRYSAHSTTDLRPEQLQSFVTEAVALTRALQPDPFRELPAPELFECRPDADLDLVDGGVDALDRDARMAWMTTMDEKIGAEGGDKVISRTSGVQDGHSMGAAASSNGFFGTWERTSVWMGTEVTVRDEGDKRPEGWHWVGGRHREQLGDPAEIAAYALRDATRRLGADKGPTKRGLMIVEPRAARRLVGSLLGPASGRSIQQGRSFFADKLGEAVASDKLTIVDDPLLVRGLGSRHFDGEGISAKALPLIEAGVLKNWYLDTYYAKKLEMDPTTGSGSNRVVTPGERDLAAIIADADEAVLVTSWLGGNSDGTTGDFSFGMRGHLVKNGEVGGPIGEMNVTGNLLELFAKLVEVGSDPWIWSTTLVPTLVFDGVQFSGA